VPLKPRNNAAVIRIAAPVKALVHRFLFVLLVTASALLIMVARVDPVLVDQIRTRVVDAFAPILGAFAAPAATVARGMEALEQAWNVYEENQRLREQNARLLPWQQAALRLEAENRSLRSLLNVRTDPSINFITARVVAEPGGAFVRTMLVMAGRRDGVRPGQAVISGMGLVGRVVGVGEWSSRILLITDLNARVPVMLERAQVRAILGGDNTDMPRLVHLSADVHVSVGDRVVTSGTGGLFPPGLPVGVVSSVHERTVRVRPLAELGSLEHVKILDFGFTAEPPEPKR